ncbi:MAG TPA: M20 family metallopeptidase [Acidimicrobiales bacterium]|nr:M20 family metallopeptidase [Acidimicrobiales bacterium]
MIEQLDRVVDEAQARLDEAVALRRRLHERPELGLDLPETQAAVIEALDGLPVTTTTGSTTSSVVAVLDGDEPGPTVLLRGDMDALPMPEDTGLDYASRVDGAMHACGHDTHVAMLAGAAQLLAARRSRLAGRVVFMFQPGEEGHAGARHMLDEGLLETAGAGAEPVSLAFAIHQSPSIPSGMIASKGRSIMASADEFQITVRGRGGHASMPHQAADPIPVAAEIITAIQAMVTRRVDAFDPAVVTVAKLRAGTTTNVIPETATMWGTIRAVSAATREAVLADLERVADGIAAAHGATAELELFDNGYPVTVNDEAAARFALDTAAALFGRDLAIELPQPVMGAEDWSYVLERVPGAMAFLGTRPPGVAPRDVAPNHSNRMVLDEGAMAPGIATYSAVALRWLSSPPAATPA